MDGHLEWRKVKASSHIWSLRVGDGWTGEKKMRRRWGWRRKMKRKNTEECFKGEIDIKGGIKRIG